jgi:alpha-1,3-mannosyltransferase
VSKTIKVLQVSARYFPDVGGTETHVFETTQRLNKMAGLTVDVLTTDPTRSRARTEVVAGTTIMRVSAWPANKDYYLAPAVASVIRRGDYDLIHCQGIHNAVPVIAMTAARTVRTPYVVTPHTGGHSSRVRGPLRNAQWRALGPLVRRADRLICVAAFEADMFARTTGIARHQISVIPNGTDTAPPSSDLSPDPEKPTVVCVGRLERYKGQHHLIAALPDLLELEPRARLMLVGQGPNEQPLRQQAERLGVADRVVFTHLSPAERTAMSDLLAQAHVVSLLSDYEAHPVAVMEAVSLGRPVVVAPNAGLAELADRGLAESVSDPSDAALVAKTLARHLHGDGASARLDAPAPLAPTTTWDECAQAIAEIYRAYA